MAIKPKRTAQEIAARKRAMARALQLNAERRKREEELTGLAADFLTTRELETDVRSQLEEQITALRTAAEAECVRLRQQGAAVVARMVARGEGAGRIAGRLGVRVGEVRLLRDEAAVERGQETASREGRRHGRGDGAVAGMEQAPGRGGERGQAADPGGAGGGAAVGGAAAPSGVVPGVAGPVLRPPGTPGAGRPGTGE
ncbi:hypothetical protein ACFU7X_37340 [Streptomyces chartreusis]|uniref:hypothetical protein n=1 Tax=Streptomyces chartreusis TaxID=1969 RepID=UPI0036AF29BF